jgi:uncharacterized protein (DUF2147 family)
MHRLLLQLLLAMQVAVVSAAAQNHGVIGTWREPGGAVIVIALCGGDLCARLAHLPTGAPTRDVNNPDQSLRARPLCGLSIGQGFHSSDQDHASGGKLYDPKSGKTYSGSMVSSGEELRLRGYVGFKAFGRTEVWHRTGPVPTCTS